MKSPKILWSGKSRRRLSLYLVMLLCFTCVTLVLVNSHLENKATQKAKESKENLKSKIEESITEEIIPNEQTEFFSKEEGKALLYYTIVNDSVRFFKAEGTDPVTGQKLLPVTQDIVDQYQESVKPKNELAITDVKSHTVSEVKFFKKKEKKKTIIKKRIKRDGIWNNELINTTAQDEISLFVFNEQDQIDEALTKQFKDEFAKKKYFVTDELIYTSEMTNEIVHQLKASNTEYFKGKLKEYTDFICIGVVSYSYDDNPYRNDFTDCILKIDYFIYDAGSGEQMFAEKDKVIGSAQTKQKAKKEAIDKFIL